MNKLLLVISTIFCQTALAGIHPMQMAIAVCDTEKVVKLLKAKVDPTPVIKWFATASTCADEKGLATAKVLFEAGAKFDPDVLNSIAFRRMPKTLEYLCGQHLGDPTRALRTIAKSGDRASIQVLLNAGADPKILETPKPKPPPPPVKLRCERHPLSAEQSQLLAQNGIDRSRCKFVQPSGDLILIDCDSPADGPAYYINVKTSKVVATCGGACMAGNCKNCPPADWHGECAL